MCPLQWTTYTRMSPAIILPCLFSVLILYLYVRLNDAKLMQLPHEVASAFSPKRLSARDALEAAAISERTTLDAKSFLPPRTGRRYIVVGGVCSASISFVAQEKIGATDPPATHPAPPFLCKTHHRQAFSVAGSFAIYWNAENTRNRFECWIYAPPRAAT